MPSTIKECSEELIARQTIDNGADLIKIQIMNLYETWKEMQRLYIPRPKVIVHCSGLLLGL